MTKLFMLVDEEILIATCLANSSGEALDIFTQRHFVNIESKLHDIDKSYVFALLDLDLLCFMFFDNPEIFEVTPKKGKPIFYYWNDEYSYDSRRVICDLDDAFKNAKKTRRGITKIRKLLSQKEN